MICLHNYINTDFLLVTNFCFIYSSFIMCLFFRLDNNDPSSSYKTSGENNANMRRAVCVCLLLLFF